MFSIFVSAFFLGIVSNLHCVGMCGPIIMAIPFSKKENTTKIAEIIEYHLGRIFTYALLGFLIGLIGFGFKLIGYLQVLSILSGIGIIIYAWRKHLNSLFNRKSNGVPFFSFFSSKMSFLFKKEIPFKLFLFGVLNGLLPCGMVYTGLITAVSTGSPIYSAYTLFFFGLGTLPGLILFSFYSDKITHVLKRRINKLLPILITIIGLLILIRGLNIKIPYLSSSFDFNEETKEIKLEECH